MGYCTLERALTVVMIHLLSSGLARLFWKFRISGCKGIDCKHYTYFFREMNILMVYWIPVYREQLEFQETEDLLDLVDQEWVYIFNILYSSLMKKLMLKGFGW